MSDYLFIFSGGSRLSLQAVPYLREHGWCLLPGEVVESGYLEPSLAWQEEVGSSWFGDRIVGIDWEPDFGDPNRVVQVVASVAAQSFRRFCLRVRVSEGNRKKSFSEFAGALGLGGELSFREMVEKFGLVFEAQEAGSLRRGDIPSGDYVLFLRSADLLHPMGLFILAKEIQKNSAAGYSFFETIADDQAGGPHAVRMHRGVSRYSVFGGPGISGSFAVSREVLDDLGPEWVAGSWNIAFQAIRKDFELARIPLALTEVRLQRNVSVEIKDFDGGSVRENAVDLADGRNCGLADWTWDPARGSGKPIPKPSRAALAVIIPFRDQEELTAATFRSLAAQSIAGRVRLVAVDNGSDGEIAGRLRSLAEDLFGRDRITWLSVDEPFNFARLNNRGVAACEESHLLFLNNDVEFTGENDLAHMQGFLEWPEVGMAGGALYYPDGQLQAAGISFGAAGPEVVRDRDAGALVFREVDALTFACAMARRQAFEAVGGLDEMICPNGFGDALLGHRMTKAGWRILCDPSIRIRHHESKSRGSRPEEMERAEMVAEGIPLCLYGTEFVREGREMIHRFGRSRPTLGKRVYRAVRAFLKELTT